MAPGPRTRKSARKTTQTPTFFRLKRIASPSAPIRLSSRLIFRRSLPTLPAGSPQAISDSTTTPPGSGPSPAASFSSTATPPSLPPSPRPTPSPTEVIPLAWFHSDSARDKFLSRFLHRSVHACEIVNVESIRAEHLEFIEYLLQSHCFQLLDLTAEYYPQLVPDIAHLSSAVLKRNPRLLYYILVRTILPQPTSTALIPRKTLELLYLLLTGKPINFARYILSCMSKVSSVLRPVPLPYANLLTRIFRHFGVTLTNEVFETKHVPIITPVAFNSIHFFKTVNHGWKFIDDMTPDELLRVSNSSGPHVPPRVSSDPSPPPSSLLDQLQHLDERLYDLQETADKLEYILVQHTDALDDIAHNQAIMDNRLNRIQTLLTTHITEVHQKLGDLIQIGSLTRQCALKAVPFSAAERAQSAAYASQMLSATNRASQHKL
ncbi:hypothetical protein Cgig2_026256 [Carnegiea gigantea]|uniref:Uncharacterized protein n=1 Tax=Carnegiea gigantea TaxID=171969 RepID=A0A9Q1KII1_9CARY|nr:hypothetical protein Cgig2_026256 [Carnegiea gigantea]